MGRTRSDEEYLAALADLEEQLGAPPTLSELATRLEMASPPAVRSRLIDLADEGYVERRTGRVGDSRLWRISQMGREAIGAK